MKLNKLIKSLGGKRVLASAILNSKYIAIGEQPELKKEIKFIYNENNKAAI